jgi:predicted Zn-dependent peptidase
MVEDNPEEYVFDLFNTDFYQGDALGLPVLGYEETVESFSRSQLLKHYKGFHGSRSMIITAVGRIDHEGLVRKVEMLFSGYPDGGKAVPEFGKAESHPGIYVYEKDLEHTYLCLATKGVSQIDQRRYGMYALNTVVGGSMSSHLFQEVREKRGLVYNIFSYINCFQDVGDFGIATSSSTESLEEVVGLIRKETQVLKDEGIRAHELAFSKEHIKGNFFISLEGSEARMGRLAKNEIYFGSYEPIKETLKKIDRVQKSNVDEMCKLVFGNPETMALGVLGPVDRDHIERLWRG